MATHARAFLSRADSWINSSLLLLKTVPTFPFWVWMNLQLQPVLFRTIAIRSFTSLVSSIIRLMRSAYSFVSASRLAFNNSNLCLYSRIFPSMLLLIRGNGY